MSCWTLGGQRSDNMSSIYLFIFLFLLGICPNAQLWLIVFSQSLLFINWASGLEGTARSFSLMVINSRHIRENVIILSKVYLMVIKHVPGYSRKGSSCILMSFLIGKRLQIIRVKCKNGWGIYLCLIFR